VEKKELMADRLSVASSSIPKIWKEACRGGRRQ
jgi:hypothetical protein